MRRLLVLLFLVMTSLQLALAGQLDQRASLRTAQVFSSTDAIAVVSVPCAAHVGQTDEAQASPCQASQPCQACTLCQACHPTALTGAPPDSPVAPRAALFLPVVASAYFSAERAPSFKPPIL